MNKIILVKSMILGASAALLSTGCVVHEVRYRPAPPPPVVVEQPVPPPPVVEPAPTIGAEVVVTAPPPPPVQEVYVAPPGPDFVFVGGAWVWHGRWVWERGHYVHPPRHGARWIAPHYENRGGVHVFISGGWR